jgi:hypothetical protein
MGLSRRTVETLVDLVEIKLSCMEVYDRDDAREIANLERCLGELRTLLGRESREAAVVAFPSGARPGPKAAV